jgi:hypothetical protein
MLKYYSLFIGENPDYTAGFSPAGKRKIALLAGSMLIPVMLWFINAFLMTKHVLAGSFGAALLAGSFAAFIVYLLERTIVLSKGGRLMYGFRLTLGFLIAILGSISLDEVIFKNDIDNKVNEYRSTYVTQEAEKAKLEYSQNIADQQNKTSHAYADWQNKLEKADAEMKGKAGSSGYRGLGDIAKQNLQMAEDAKKEYDTQSAILNNLLTDQKREIELVEQTALAGFNGHALLLRIRAMFEMVMSDPYMMAIYIILTLFLFCLEFLVVIVKMSSDESPDEKMELARDLIAMQQTQKILERHQQHFKAESLLPGIRRANEFIHSKHGSVLN